METVADTAVYRMFLQRKRPSGGCVMLVDRRKKVEDRFVAGLGPQQKQLAATFSVSVEFESIRISHSEGGST